jgi:predicted PurR-regulated permease PerM
MRGSNIGEHLRVSGGAVKRWFIGTLMDAGAVGAMWLVGLLIIGVPWAPLWALIGALAQFVPNVGPVLAVAGPVLTVGGIALFDSANDFMPVIYVFILFAIIAVVDGLFLQPYFMKRTNKVPIWASIVAPIVLGIVIPFWGVLLAGPLLAIIYTYRARRRQPAPVIPMPRRDMSAEQLRPELRSRPAPPPAQLPRGEVLPPERRGGFEG